MNAHAGADLPSKERLRRQLMLWRGDIPAFAYDVCGMRCEAWLEAVYADIALGYDVSVRSCHGPGKTAGASVAILWFMATRFPTRVPCTAPTSHQLNDVLWSEIAKWLAEMNPEWRDRYRYTTLRLEWAAAPRQSFAVGRTARPGNDEALQGFHAPHVLYVVDEATGVGDGTFETAEGAMTEAGAQQLLLSNPTRLNGYMYDTHHSMRAHFACHHVSAFDTERVTDTYVERMAKKWGRTSNIFRVRVLGEWPKSEADTVIPFEDAHAAVGRDITRDPRVAPVWGVDVAWTGADDSALSKRQGYVLLEAPKSWHGLDPMQLAGTLYREYQDEPEATKPARICIDVIGLGAGVYARLDEMLKDEPVDVVAVNVSERPSNRENYLKLRDELWFQGREWFQSALCTLPDAYVDPATGEEVNCDDLLGELTAVKYHPPNSEGKLKVYSKEEMQRAIAGKPPLLRHSPNLADSFLNTFALPDDAPQRTMPEGRSRRRQVKQRRSLSWVA